MGCCKQVQVASVQFFPVCRVRKVFLVRLLFEIIITERIGKLVGNNMRIDVEGVVNDFV